MEGLELSIVLINLFCKIYRLSIKMLNWPELLWLPASYVFHSIINTGVLRIGRT